MDIKSKISIRSGHQWDGAQKPKTEQCETCDKYHREIGGKEYCGYSPDFRLLTEDLTPVHQTKACPYCRRPVRKNASVHYLDEQLMNAS